jgi:hypothetical protein
MYSHHQVRLEKVAFSGKVSAGLKAGCFIPAATCLLTTCSSMAQGIALGGGFSVIESHPSQKGPTGPRVLLGPLRFANHDCDPTCQVCTT